MASAIEKESNALRKIQKELARIVSMTQDYVLKKHENDMVKEVVFIQELQLMNEGKVYKLVGPVLIPQSLEDAKTNVDKRLEYIIKEM